MMQPSQPGQSSPARSTAPAQPAAPTPPAASRVANELLAAARELSQALGRLAFAPPVAHVYNPHDYAWAPYEAYVTRFATGARRLVFLGMNPGPFGMMQTGVPFGEVAAVRDWMGIGAPPATEGPGQAGRAFASLIQRPAREHPARPIQGFDCRRSEVSGRRLWSWAQSRWGSAETFFADCFVLNYCPLVWLEESGRNRTPAQLPAAEMRAVRKACDEHLTRALQALSPEWAIGIGGFAEERLREVLASGKLAGDLAPSVRIGQILHPSPASPAANRGWQAAVEARLAALGITLA